MPLRALSIATGLLIWWGTALRVSSAAGPLDYSFASDNRSTHVMAMIMVALPIVGGAFGATWTRFGVGAGSALVSGAWAACAVAMTLRDAPPSLRGGDIEALVALGAFWAAALAGTATFVLASLRRPLQDISPPVPGAQWVLGVVSSGALALGLLLPADTIEEGFVARNLDLVEHPARLAWLAFVVAVAAAGVIGFASRSRWGLSVVVASMVPMAWMMLVYRKGLDYPGEAGVTLVMTFEVHHLVLFAACGQALAVAIGMVAAWHAEIAGAGTSPGADAAR